MFYNFTYIKMQRTEFPGTFAVVSLHMRVNLAICLYPNRSLIMSDTGIYTVIDYKINSASMKSYQYPNFDISENI